METAVKMIIPLKLNTSMITTPLWVKAFLISSVAFFIPVVPAIILVTTFVIVDTITGIWAAVKSGEEITSRKMSHVISKLIIYQLAMLLAYGLDVVLLGGGGIFVDVNYIMTKIIAAAIIFIEVKSIDENAVKITGRSMIASLKEVFTRAVKAKNDLGQ
jgi:hypothetical protein